MKSIWFFGALVINTIIVTPLLWYVSTIGYYAFLLQALSAAVSIIIAIISPGESNRKAGIAVLLGTLASLPAVFAVSFIMLIASGGMC